MIALRTLVQSIFHTLKALLWALLLLLLIVFVFSVLIAQAISDFTIDLEEQNLEALLMLLSSAIIFIIFSF